MKLYQHQQDILDKSPKRCGLFLGCGGGKTTCALTLVAKNGGKKALVICPKTQKLDKNWERELAMLQSAKWASSLEISVVSKEEIKKVWRDLPYFDAVIIDESHTATGVYPDTNRKRKKGVDTPKASQIFWAIYDYLAKHRPEMIYLCTATPTRSPMSVWGAARLLGKGWDFYQFRSMFYNKVKMNGYDRWMPRKTEEAKEKLGELVRSIGHTGKLEDWFDVPDQLEKTIHCPLTKEQESVIKKLHLDFPEPIVLLGKQHQVENGVLHTDEYTEDQFFNNNKIATIIDFTYEFDKIVVFAKYLNQIEQIKNKLEEEGIQVFLLTGATKDRQKVIALAEASERCVFIAQSAISAGYELPSFPCMIFASASYVHLDLEQGRGRILRANKLKKNLYVYLESGEIDKAVWKALRHKQDFHEKIYVNEKRS